MNNLHTLTYLKKKYWFNGLQVEIEIEENPYQLQLSQVFLLAGRINKKRSFLFVSKLLGKHLPINPKVGILTGAILAERYCAAVGEENLSRKKLFRDAFLEDGESYSHEAFVENHHNPVIIGFAETATALGHAFFESFKNANYFHTTREELISETPVITFEEEHSHATSHRCYVDEQLLDHQREIILVDDELTTGKTAINIIRSLHKKFPRKQYSVISILDWRSNEHQKAFKELEQELAISINCVSLIKGKMRATGNLELEQTPEPLYPATNTNQKISYIRLQTQSNSLFPTVPVDGTSEILLPYLYETGRFGMASGDNPSIQQWIESVSQQLKQKRTGLKTLCLGTGEFMYVPMKIASLMGSGVKYHSTTRSPIYAYEGEDYGANWKIVFANPENLDVTNYVYNIPPNGYDEVFIFFEREVADQNLQPLFKQFEKTGIKDIKIVYLSSQAASKFRE